MQFQTCRIAAKGVGQEQVAARIHRLGIKAFDPVGMLIVPHFGGIARLQAHVEEIGAGGPIGENPIAGGKHLGEGVCHLGCPILREHADVPPNGLCAQMHLFHVNGEARLYCLTKHKGRAMV